MRNRTDALDHLVIVLVLWLLGVIGSIGGSFIDLLLLLVAGVILVLELLSGRRTV